MLYNNRVISIRGTDTITGYWLPAKGMEKAPRTQVSVPFAFLFHYSLEGLYG